MSQSYTPDGYFSAKIGKRTVPVCVEVKGHVDHLHQIRSFMRFTENFDGLLILAADAIAPTVKDLLKGANIGYWEKGHELYLPLTFKTEKVQRNDESSLVRSTGLRTEASIKLLFFFIAYPESLRFTQRQLAEKLDFSLTSINTALKNLEKTKCIHTIEDSTRALGAAEEVIARWRTAYSDKVRNKLCIGRFSPVSDDFFDRWDVLDISSSASYWGGETAASLQTNYLRPEIFTLYSYTTHLTDLLKSLRLKKDAKGKIEILSAFWPEHLNTSKPRAVPTFLTYCDLLNSGVDRNIETAQLLKKPILDSWSS